MIQCTPSLLNAMLKQLVRARNNILKALAGTSWVNRKIIILTYQALGRSVIDYAAPVWAPLINDTTWKYVQTSQNEALRIATGCHKMAHTDHLHRETKLLPVKYHSELLAKQYWLSCHRPHHPCHHLSTESAPPRNMKGTLQKYNAEVVMKASRHRDLLRLSTHTPHPSSYRSNIQLYAKQSPWNSTT